MTDKQVARAALDRMPETVSLEEISDEMAILAGILAGQADIDAGRYVTQAEAVRRSETWITK